ncbi:diguanylate cyclase, partial [Cronobacter sakazakii]|uniref:GGDEF domain-containing protein n=1 Tax=Cronobacter sakazakii TaxID=28141 RepID=UPI002893AC40
AHSQKMKAVGQLTGGLAHDFNNLLAVIIGSLELIAPGTPDAPRINRALKAAERGAQLTARLLAFSRKQSLNPRSVAMKTLLENIQELIRHSLPASITLEIEAQQRVDYLSHHDELTGLPNRVQMKAFLEGKLRAKPTTERPLAMIMLDLDKFKPVNDLFGHAAGDDVLHEMSSR